MLEYALITLLAPFALTPNELIEELRICRVIQEGAVRLQCYDNAVSAFEQQFPEAPVAPAVAAPASEEVASAETVAQAVESSEEPAPAPERETEEVDDDPEEAVSTGRWILNTGPSPADGKPMTWATLRSVGDGSRQQTSAQLVVRCESGVTSVAIDWGEYLREASPSVRTRVDDLPPLTAKWTRSTDKQSSVYRPSGGSKRVREQRVKGFALSLQSAEKLVARVTPSGQSAVTAIFRLSGFPPILKSIRQACKW